MKNNETKFYGWRAVAAAFVVAVFGWGLGFYGPPVYLDTVVRTRGWPIATVSGAVTLHFLVGALAIASLPALHRRYGLPAVTIMGAATLAFGVLGWAVAQSPWQLYVATLFSGAGWPALGAVAVNAIVSPWFVRKRPSALSAAYNGASIGGVIFSPLWVMIIAWIGFAPAALIVSGLMFLIITALAATILRHTPENTGQFPDGETPPEGGVAPHLLTGTAPVQYLSRDFAFLTLSLAMALTLFAQIGLLTHLVSLLVPTLGVQGAGLAAGLSTAAAILGRQLVGWFMPVYADRRAVASISLLVQVLGCVCLLSATDSSIYRMIAGVILIGLGIGNATSLPPLIAQVEFSKVDVARVVALIVAISQAAYAFAPATFGFIRENVSEQAIYITAVGVQAAAIVAYMAGRQAYASRALVEQK